MGGCGVFSPVHPANRLVGVARPEGVWLRRRAGLLRSRSPPSEARVDGNQEAGMEHDRKKSFGLVLPPRLATY